MRRALSKGGVAAGWIAVAFLATGFALDPQDGGEDPIVVALRAELAQAREAWAVREAQLVAEVESLRGELRRVEDARLEREREWLVWTSAISKLAPVGVVEVPDFELELSPEELETLAPDAKPIEEPRDEALIARSEEIERSLRTLLRLEWVDGLVLLEAGLLSDEGWIGPCVFRIIGANERAVGSVSAERLHIEGSVTGRTLTLVMAEGYERRSGDLIPFEGADEGQRRGGERRIVLVHTDPRPWMDAMPELFREPGDAPILRASGRTPLELCWGVNQLLAEDVAGGRWRLERFEDMTDSGLAGVDLVDLNTEGAVKRHLFADRLRVERREQGVVLVLTDGVQMQGSRKTPFLGGRFRIFLPRARHEGWEKVGLLVVEAGEPPVEEAGGGTPGADGR